MPRPSLNYVWTSEEQDLLVRMREDPERYTWQQTIDRLGPGCTKNCAASRYGRLKRGEKVITYSWHERHEEELARLLKAGYTGYAISKRMKVPLNLIKQRTAIIEKADEVAAQSHFQGKERPFLDRPMQWGAREDEVLIRLHLTYMELTDIQLLGLFGNPNIDFIRERMALHLPTREHRESSLYQSLLTLYNNRLDDKHATRWTAEDVLRGNFEFLTDHETFEEQIAKEKQRAAEEKRRKFLYDRPQRWTAKEDKVLLRLFLAGMEPSTMDTMGLFGTPGVDHIRDRIARHSIALSSLNEALHRAYNDPATRWTSKDVLRLEFEFTTAQTATGWHDKESQADAEYVGDLLSCLMVRDALGSLGQERSRTS